MLNGTPKELVIKNTKDNINNLFKGLFNIKDFIITKTLKGNYVDRTKHAHVVLADRMA